MLTEPQINNAISLNRYYAQFLYWQDGGRPTSGWVDRFSGIVTLLGLTNSVDERAFAVAVEAWQSCRVGLVHDGVIGTNTWAQMEPLTRANANSCFIRPPAFERAASGRWSPPFQQATTASSLAMPGRGFMFVVVEMLPEVGARNLVRKIAVVPRDFVMRPANPLGIVSAADHALNLNPTQSPWLSASNRPFGAPTMQGRPLLIDIDAVRRAGGRIVSEADLIADLQRAATQNPSLRHSVDRLISTIRGVEGETLVGGRPSVTGRPLSAAHSAYVRNAEALWAQHTSRQISRAQLEQGLAGLDDAYRGSRAVGRVGRVFMVLGVVMTAVDMGHAAHQSVQQESFRPIAAETVRQVGGWGGALAGAKIGGLAGAAVGIETGPGAIVTGAIGAIIFGAAGYFGADWVADMINEN